jgi:hypothetical protein
MTKQQAFEQLEKKSSGIPFDAVEYLYNHEQDTEIEQKIIFYLENAHNEEVMYDPKTGYSEAPLRYAIVAENHISESYIDPLIKLFTTTTDDWDLLYEQGSYLIAKTCEVLGDTAVKRYMDAIEEQIKQDTRFPYLFLYECLQFADKEKYKDQVLRFLENPEVRWLDPLATELGAQQFHYTLPRLKELLDYFTSKKKDWLDEYQIAEIQEGIDYLDPIQSAMTRTSRKSYYQSRGDWKPHYQNMERLFEKKEELPMPPVTIETKKKVGRNEPCPCGSGKKYKKCCWPDYN